MFDGSFENPTALFLLLFAAMTAGPAAMAALVAPGRPLRLGEFLGGGAAMLALWGLLVPLNVYNHARGESLVLLFGAEANDTGLVEYGTVALLLTAAGLAASLARTARGLQGLLYGLLAVAAFLVAGEEISWGQWIFHWATPQAIDARNLQHETNLHNFLPPGFWGDAYAAVGWALIAAVIALRFTGLNDRLRFQPFDAVSNGRAVPALFLGAGVLMQHPFFQEVSELALATAIVFALVQLNGARRRPAAEPAGQLQPVAA